MNYFPKHYPAFLWTEISSETKPLALRVGDHLLSQGRIFTRYYDVKIGSEGIPYYNSSGFLGRIPVVVGMIFGYAAAVYFKKTHSIFSITGYYMAISFTVKVIHEAVFRLLVNPSLSYPTRIIVALAHNILCVAAVKRAAVKRIGIAHPVVLMSCFITNLFVGAVFKTLAWSRDSTVQNSFNHYFSVLRFDAKDTDVPYHHEEKDLKEEITKDNNLKLWSADNLTSDVRAYCIDFFSSSDLFLLRSCTNGWYGIIRIEDLLKKRIFESFSPSFIGTFGIITLCNILQAAPLPECLINLPIEGIENTSQKFFEKAIRIETSLDSLMKDRQFAWGKTVNKELYLFFKDRDKRFIILRVSRDSKWENSLYLFSSLVECQKINLLDNNEDYTIQGFSHIHKTDLFKTINSQNVVEEVF